MKKRFMLSMVVLLVVALAFAVFMIISWWIVLKKAGQPGWATLIPVYNFLILLAGRKKKQQKSIIV